MKEIFFYLKKPQRFINLCTKSPKGILFFSSPGTYKTLLAKAIDSEENASFYYTSGSEFDEMIVGLEASHIRRFFNKNFISAIFIDEIGSVGKQEKRQLTIEMIKH